MKRLLGQHFLFDKEKLKKIVEALELKLNDLVIEIGAGHGELTEELWSANHEVRIIAIEKDQRLAKDLEYKIQNLGLKNIKIIEGDALKILPKLVNSILKTSDALNVKNNFWTSDVQKLKIVGNIPYYITGHLLKIIGELENKPSLIVLTLQKEVAERICSKPPKMNLLAASVQFWAEPKIIGYIPKTAFSPQPKVDSAIIRLKSTTTPVTFAFRSSNECNGRKINKLDCYLDYYKFIKILFKQPRKIILNNLTAGLKISKEEIIKKLTALKIKPADRPQNLSISQIIDLINVLR